MLVHSRKGAAVEWLRKFIEDSGGEVASGVVKAAARHEGFSNGTLWRACNDLGIVSVRQAQFHPSAIWRIQ